MRSQSGGSDGSGDGPARPRRGAAGRAHDPSMSGSRRPTIEAPRQRTQPFTWARGNRVLAAVPADELAFLRPTLVTISLGTGAILYEQGSRIETVYFPDTVVASLVSRMENGAAVEVGTIGNEGVVGLNLFLGADVSVPEAVAQIPGDAQRMSARDFRSALDALPRFRELIGKCTHAFMTQVSQTAACNRLHGIEQRCARWLLLTHDRVGGGDEFPLTHQFLSFMLGVRRAGVTEALGALTLAGLIRSGTGRITILDRVGLEAACCECYAIVRRHAGEPFDVLE
jgi:CRP-like cAMP-binding protein